MSRHPVLHLHADLAGASQALADWVAACLRSVLEQQDRASVALPGGSTPGLFPFSPREAGSSLETHHPPAHG